MKAIVLLCVVASSLFAALAWSQTRDDSWDASGADWATLLCYKNGDGSIECSVCLRPITSSTGIEDRPCSRPRVLRAANTTRVDTVGSALVPSALRQAKFDVDAGAP